MNRARVIHTRAMSTIDLARGHPSSRLLALNELSVATNTVLKRFAENSESSDQDRHPLQYGTDQGPLSVRTTIADWFSHKYNVPSINPGLLGVTCGASYGLANTLLQFADAHYTRRIFMITPAYFLAARIFQDAGFGEKLCAIDETDDGFDYAQLEEILQRDQYTSEQKMSGTRYRYLFYCVPTFANPTGIVWSLHMRVKLLELARHYDMLICSDEVYDFLDYRNADSTMLQTPIRRFVDLDSEDVTSDYGNTLSNMSFSKYLGPGMRCGIVQGATERFMLQWSAGGANHSGGATAQMTSYFVAEIVQSGMIESVLSNLRGVYRERAKKMLDAVRARFPEGTEIFGGEGGYFMWIQLPPGYSAATEILRVAKTQSDGAVLSHPGSAFEVPGDTRGFDDRCIRISLSLVEADLAVEGLNRLARAVESCKST